MTINSLFYGALRCTDVMLDGVVSFYSSFVYKVLYRPFPNRGTCFWPYNCIGWREVLYCWWMRFFIVFFKIIWDIFLEQILLTLMLVLLKILARGLLLGKCLVIKFTKSLPILDVIHLFNPHYNKCITSNNNKKILYLKLNVSKVIYE